nr:response regulator [Desulfolucanica intricata]
MLDGDKRNIFALTTVLENHKVNVFFDENEKIGIKTLEENPGIDFVLMDMMMPEMDDYKAIKVIRQNPKYETLPIIALTAKAMKNDQEKGINAGATDYISKPVNLLQPLFLIKVCINRCRAHEHA